MCDLFQQEKKLQQEKEKLQQEAAVQKQEPLAAPEKIILLTEEPPKAKPQRKQKRALTNGAADTDTDTDNKQVGLKKKTLQNNFFSE